MPITLYRRYTYGSRVKYGSHVKFRGYPIVIPLIVEDLQSQIATILDQSNSSPEVDGTEWNLRLGFINRALEEYSSQKDWTYLTNTYSVNVGVSQASVAMPSDLKKPFKVLFFDGVTGGRELKEIKPEETGLYDDDDYYFYLLGNRGNSTMIINPSPSANTSLKIDYYFFPPVLSTASQVVPISNSQFIVERAIGFIQEARLNSNFQQNDFRSKEILNQIKDDYEYKGRAYRNQVFTEGKINYPKFRIGK